MRHCLLGLMGHGALEGGVGALLCDGMRLDIVVIACDAADCACQRAVLAGDRPPGTPF